MKDAMSNRGRRSNVRACFQEPEHGANIHPAILKQARKSGQLNLSGRGLTEVPETVWKINVDVPPESRNVSMENQDDRWWEQTDLTKLILASNAITDLTDNIQMLPALTVLDVHDNQLNSLPEAIGTLVNLQKLNASHNGLKGLPQSIGNLKNLRLLQVHHNQITEVSDNIGELHDLEELDMSNNKLTNLPLGIGFLTRILHFNFSNNQIKVLPHEIGSMQALRTLDATHNVIHTLPEELGDLRHLELLYLRHNKLTHLPVLRHCTNLKELHLGNNSLQGLAVENLECIPQLCVLDLRDNKISRIPDQITVLQELERLDVSNNDISQLPFTLGTMVKLKCIVLDGNPMKSIRRDIVMRGTNELKKYLRSRLAEPENDVTEKTQGLRKSKGMSGIIGGTQEGIDAFSIHNTKSLDYSGKGVSQIPADLWPVAEAARVNTVNFNKNLLQTVPQELSSLSSSLTELYLAFNKLTSLDAIIGELTKLMMLDIRNNQISSLPDSLVNLQDLRELVISFNKFKELPKVVYNMSSLEILLANDNQIQTVDPDGVKGLSRLSSLNLQNNDIMNVPPELGLCTQLRALQLEGNPFRHPRPAVLLKGTDALLEYLRNRIVA